MWARSFMDLMLDMEIGFVDLDNIPCVGYGDYKVMTISNLTRSGENYAISWDFPRHDKNYAVAFAVDDKSRVVFKSSFAFKLPCGQVTYPLLNRFRMDLNDLQIIKDIGMGEQVVTEHAIVATFGQPHVPVSVKLNRSDVNGHCYISCISCVIPKAIGDEWFDLYVVATKQIMKSQ